MSDLITEPQVQPPGWAPKRRWYLRAWFIVPVALVIAGTIALTVLFAVPKTVTVRGTVVDRMHPNLKVAAATLRADGRTAKTNAAGAFIMTGVPRNATLQVRAPAYAGRSITASGQHMTIALTPIPVTVTVTSAMTGAPVKATITAAPGAPVPYTVASGGLVRIYRAAPGETMTVTARGYLPLMQVVRSDGALAAALNPTVSTMWRQFTSWANDGKATRIVSWVLRPTAGYIFMKPPARVQAQLNSLRDPLYELYYTARDIAGTDAWIEITIDKPSANLDIHAVANQYLGRTTMIMIGGRPAWHGGPDNHGSYGTLIRVGIIDLEVYGDSTAQTDRIIRTILRPLGRPAA